MEVLLRWSAAAAEWKARFDRRCYRSGFVGGNGGSKRRRGSKLTGPESEGTSTWLTLIRASIEFAEDSPLCTEPIPRWSIQETGEYLLSALEAMEVDNCRIENSDSEDVWSER